MTSWRTLLPIALPLAIAASPASPGLALAIGVLVSLLLPSWVPENAGTLRKFALQGSVIAMGLAVDPPGIARAAASGALLSLATLAGTFLLGALLARLLGVPGRTAGLVCSGTAICGGSAIAAAGSAIDADPAEMGGALGAVFLLNAVGLYLFPWIAHLAGLSPVAFGTWSGLALHDLSAVVGAAAPAGTAALGAALATKLARTLWIAPVSLGLGFALGTPGSESGRRIRIPWFLAGFFGLALLRWLVPSLGAAGPAASALARRGMAGALFLVGTGLDRATLRRTGPRTLAMAVALWAATAGGTFWLVRSEGL